MHPAFIYTAVTCALSLSELLEFSYPFCFLIPKKYSAAHDHPQSRADSRGKPRVWIARREERVGSHLAGNVRLDSQPLQLTTLVVGLKVPTQLALYGAKMARPSLAVAASRNLLLTVIWDEMSMQMKTSVFGSKLPTQSALLGTKTTRPLANVAPENL